MNIKDDDNEKNMRYEVTIIIPSDPSQLIDPSKYKDKKMDRWKSRGVVIGNIRVMCDEYKRRIFLFLPLND